MAQTKDNTKATVKQIIDSFNHPLKCEVEVVRQAILSADSRITEGVKWNSLSFCTTEWFATWNWRIKDQIQFVLHLGAKKRETVNIDLSKSADLVKWLAEDRALLTISPNNIEAQIPAIQALVREWIKHV